MGKCWPCSRSLSLSALFLVLISHFTYFVGLEIWRIEKLTVVAWPKGEYGRFYNSDCYIVLNVRSIAPHYSS